MSGSWSAHDFPNLTPKTSQITSPTAVTYNCLAWAAGENFRNWWPDPLYIGYWPPNVPRRETLHAFVLAYGVLGYRPCADGALEAEVEKIALYGKGAPGAETPTHAALQLASGQWTSKIGGLEDIVHSTPDAVIGPCYGRLLCYLARPRSRCGE